MIPQNYIGPVSFYLFNIFQILYPNFYRCLDFYFLGHYVSHYYLNSDKGEKEVLENTLIGENIRTPIELIVRHKS